MHQWLQTTVNRLKRSFYWKRCNRAVIFLLMQELLTCQKLSFYIFNLIFARTITFFSLYHDFRYNLYTTKYTKVIQIAQFRTNWVGKLILSVNYPFAGKRGKHSRSKSLKNYRNIGQTSRFPNMLPFSRVYKQIS